MINKHTKSMITIQNVSKSYNGKQVVKDLSLSILAGEIYGLLGANGAGKSTTINMLLGFIDQDSGSIKVDSFDIQTQKNEIRNIVGYIPENVNLYPYLTGHENLDYFCKLAGLHYSSEELGGFLTKAGLQSDANHNKVSEYSKGMRQKVGIAIALAKQAKVYLLDEPASGLDPFASNELAENLKKIASEGSSILMASHDIFRVKEICHRIGILKNGELVKELSSDQVSANELESIYLDYMKN